MKTNAMARLCIAAAAFALSALHINAQKNIRIENLQSETPYFETIKGGMASFNCRDVVEDSDGFIWVATQNGISRFDGIYAQNFFNGTSKNKYEFDISAMCDDEFSNKIWVAYANSDRIGYLDKKSYKAKTFNYTTTHDYRQQSDYLHNKTIFSLIAYNDTLLLASTTLGMCYVNKNDTVLQGPFYQEGKHNFVHDFIRMGKRIFFTMNSGLHEITALTPDGPKYNTLDLGDSNLRARHICIKNDSTLIVETTNKNMLRTELLVEYNINSNTAKLLCNFKGNSTGIACSDDGVWMSTRDGLIFYCYQTGAVRQFDTRNSHITDNRLNHILKSKHQPILWIASADGLIKNDYYASKFSLTDLRKNSDSKHCQPLMVHKDADNGYWTFLIDDLYYRPAGQKRFEHANIDMLKDKNVLSAAEDTARRTIYFNTITNIVSYNLDTRKAALVLPAHWKRRIFNIAVRADGTLTLFDNKSIILCNPATNDIDIWDFPNAQSCFISAIAADGDSLIWYGTTNSELYKYDIRTRTSTLIQEVGNKQEKYNTRINAIKTMYRNGQREVWLTSSRRGLFYYMPDYNKMTQIEYSRFLYDELITLEIDTYQNVWVASSDGIVFINNTTGTISEYDHTSYAISPQFNRISCAGYNGEVLMAGPNYIVEFNSSNFYDNNYYPKPIVSSYKLLNSTTYTFDNITKSEYFDTHDTICIPKGIRSVQLFVRMLNYNKPENNIIQWRIPDIDSKWITTNTVSPIVFSNLPHGVHYIELRSCNNNGLPTNKTNRVYIDKSVYIYEHPVFYAVMIFLSICLVAFIIIIRARIAKQQQIKLEIEVERQAGQIRRTNEDLNRHKILIENKNRELQLHRADLERQVAARTADLEEAKLRAEESSKLKSAFLANLSHEVRTPMNCIMGFSKLLADPTCSPKDQAEFVHLIQESGNSLLVLISDLLDISKIESGQLRVNKADFEVYSDITDLFKILSVERKSPEIEFKLFIDDEIKGRIINSDRERLKQIITNLVNNAFKFTESGHVHLHANIGRMSILSEFAYPPTFPKPIYDNDLLIVRIEDTGIGIATDKTEVIFEPFRKLNNNKTHYPGLGLGLNIVKNLIKMLDGQIWLTSEEGHGTTFYFYLPFDK